MLSNRRRYNKRTYPSKYFLEDTEQRDIWRSSNPANKMEVLFIGDSIIKYVSGLSNTQVISFRGIKTAQLGARIHHGKIPQIYDAKLCVLHVGTNNIGTKNAPDYQGDSVYETLSQLHFLVDEIRRAVPDIAIAVCHILPRPKDWDVTSTKVFDFNRLLSKYKRPWGFQVIPVSRPFLDRSVLKSNLFAKDLLHLEFDGTKKYKNYVARVLGNVRHRLGINNGSTSPPPTMIWKKITTA